MKPKFGLWIGLLIFIFIAEMILLRVLIKPKEENLTGLKNEYAELEKKKEQVGRELQKQTKQLRKVEAEISSPITQAKQDWGEGVEAPTFLDYVSRLVQRLGIKYIYVQLNPPPLDSLQISYNVKVQSGYNQILNLVDNLENQLNLGVENLRMGPGRDAPGLHEASFDLTFLKADEEEENTPDPGKLEAIMQLAQVSNNLKGEPDPFYRVFPKATIGASAAKSKSVNESLMLQGIMEIKGKRVALINNHILREGDNIRDYQLVRIGQEKVELKGRKGNYMLTLSGLVSLTDAKLEKEKP